VASVTDAVTTEKHFFTSPTNRKQKEGLKHPPALLQQNVQKLKLEMGILFLYCYGLSGFNSSKTNVGRGSSENVNRLGSGVCATKPRHGGQQTSASPLGLHVTWKVTLEDEGARKFTFLSLASQWTEMNI